MRLAGSRVLPLLAARGAQVDEATGIVRLPRELVEWAIAQCPRSFTMAGATPADDVLIGADQPFRFCAERLRRQDARLSHRRAPPQHAAGPARVHGAHGRAARSSTSCGPRSAPPTSPLERRELIEYFTMLTETSQHVTFVDCPNEVDAVVRICEVLSGDLDAFRERPRFSTVCTAASPLQVDGAGARRPRRAGRPAAYPSRSTP